MMKSLLKLGVLSLLVVVLAVSAVVLIRPALAHASFNQGDIIDDGIFDNSNAFSTAGQIDSFLNSFPGSCISQNNGFAAPDVTGYSPNGPVATGGFYYGSDVSAGTVILHTAHVYGLNPQVILATMQKEEGLVRGDGPYGCSALAISAAMGDACPDSQTSNNYSGFELYSKNGTPVTSVNGICVNTAHEVGFSRQVIVATWKFKFWEQRAEGNYGWDVQLSNYPNSGNVWNNSDDPQTCYSYRVSQGWRQVSPSSCPNGSLTYYDGRTTIDGSTVTILNGPTAALYNYTPHFSGNQNFVSIFEGWFGSAHNPYFGAAYDSESSYPVLDSGAGVSVYLRFKNTGNTFWKDDLSNFPGNVAPIHMATTSPINRSSPFAADNWINAGRPTGFISAVYDSNGTLNSTSTSQHTVQPGQIGEFDFTIYAAGNIPGGVYREYFQPIAEGAPGYSWNMGGWAYLDIGVNIPSYQAAYYSQSAYPTVTHGGAAASSFFQLKNTGNSPWFDATSVPAGKLPIHLATSWPINRASIFSAGWPNSGRPDLNFSKVYEANGTTLASAQHTVQPGQIGEFDFPISAPADAATGFYQEHFQPIVEGAPGYSWNMGGGVWLGVNVQ